jgi:hypothetical protein
VVNEPSERKNHDVVEVTCRIVMDVKIHIHGITPESVVDEFTPDEDLPWEWAERQNRLLQALMRNDEALNRFLISIAKDELGSILNSTQIEGLSAEEEDELFEKLYFEMNDEDALFFREARKDGIVYENIRLVDKSFEPDWGSAKLEDVCVIEVRTG